MRSPASTSSSPIPVHRVAVVRPFVQFLSDVGAPVERGFRQVGLPYTALESVDNYIPSHQFWKFLVNMAQNQGIEDLGFRVGHQYGADSADPHMIQLLQESPTLQSGLLRASNLVNRTITHCRIGLHRPKNSNYTYFYHHPSCAADNPAIEQIGWFGITTLIGMTCVYTGPDWQPTELGIMTKQMPSDFIREQFPKARIRPLQHYSYIVFENSLLGLPPYIRQNSTLASGVDNVQSFAKDFSGSLEQIIHSYIKEKNLNLETAAKLCNLSRRTLQRRLASLGTTYREVYEHALYQSACAMLKTPHITVTDIARQLGYSDTSHFARTFRRISGVSPREYRKLYPKHIP